MNPSQRWTFGEWGFVVILLLMATAIRTVGLDFGHPDAELFPSYQALDLIHSNLPIHPDEYSYVQSPLKMVLTWGRNPEFYHNPAFLLSLNYVTYLVTGERSRLHWQDRATLDARQQAPFRLYFIGRVYSMLSGVVLTAAAYAVARRLFGRYAALNAGLLMAFSLSLVQHAHYSKSSSLAATFCALSVWAAFHTLTAKRFRWSMLALAGVCAGFAAGNRYDAAGISIVVFLVGCVVIWRARTLRVTLQVILAWAFFPTAFILAMPWAVFDTVRFLEEVTWITGQYTQGIQEHNTPRWWSLFYLYRYILLYGLGLPAAFAAVWGLLLGLRRQRERLFVWILLGYLIPYSYVVLRPTMTFNSDQLTLTSLPVWALLAGLGASLAHGRVKGRRWPTVILPVLLAAIPITLSVQLTRQFSVPDTRTQMQRWVYANIPAGAQIHLNGPYNVPLDESLYTWTQTYAGDFPTVDKMRDDYSADYVIVSDAVYNLYRRGTPQYAPAFRAEVAAYLQSLNDELELVAYLPRPPIIGTDEFVHTASYWHNPGLWVYKIP